MDKIEAILRDLKQVKISHTNVTNLSVAEIDSLTERLKELGYKASPNVFPSGTVYLSVRKEQ